jgi:hypothetical protein
MFTRGAVPANRPPWMMSGCSSKWVIPRLAVRDLPPARCPIMHIFDLTRILRRGCRHEAGHGESVFVSVGITRPAQLAYSTSRSGRPPWAARPRLRCWVASRFAAAADGSESRATRSRSLPIDSRQCYPATHNPTDSSHTPIPPSGGAGPRQKDADRSAAAVAVRGQCERCLQFACPIAGKVAHALETEVLGAIRGEITAFEAPAHCSRVSGFLPNFACAVRIASTPSMALISPRI